MIYLNKTTAVQVVVIPRNGGRLPYHKPDYIVDAPKDGKTYGRKDGNWAEVTGGGGDAYTRAESDARFAPKSNTYTKNEVDTKLSGKANSSDVYTKTETDNKVSVKANDADVVHKTGNEDIEGYKRFKEGIAVADALLLNVPNEGQAGGDVPYVYGDKYDGDGSEAPIVTFGGTMADEPCIVRGVETPQQNNDAANKKYVDGQIDVVKAFKGNPYKDLGYKADHVAALTAMLETEGLYFRTKDDDFDYYYVVTLKQSKDGFITGFFVCSEESYVVYTFYWTRGEEEVHVSGLVPTPVDNLTTSSPSIPLSANQGNVLNTKLGQLEERIDQDFYTKAQIDAMIITTLNTAI